ncbi:hypothetical protein Clacol_005171 [Clathrus columnatus]|uniref:Uncharacterized protein n=1 Tax=Clathrus columnatus TaxID=1419009 RepID=A0AAV5AB64_9AGAM|nr:hypothetical protein Clacol_005171 [Clathrus columnatus]
MSPKSDQQYQIGVVLSPAYAYILRERSAETKAINGLLYRIIRCGARLRNGLVSLSD